MMNDAIVAALQPAIDDRVGSAERIASIALEGETAAVLRAQRPGITTMVLVLALDAPPVVMDVHVRDDPGG